MRIQRLHSWDLEPAAAVALQRELAARVDVRAPLTDCTLVAGADVSYTRFTNLLYAAVVVLRAPDWDVVEVQEAQAEVTFPYVPGLLSFREAPPLLAALAQVRAEPDVVVLDGQGLAHPRRLGLASHVGLWLDRPCVGCAKSLLTGKYTDLGPKPGAVAPLVDRGEVVGEAVRTKAKVQPVYVSAGHRIDLPSAVRVVLATGRGYRVPEPTRQAHLRVNELRRRGPAP